MNRIRACYRLVRGAFALGGLAACFFLLLPLTPYPWRWYSKFGQPEISSRIPDVLVMMGGGGVPSESGLMRTWKAAEAAGMYPSTRVIVAMPLDPGEELPGLIEQELIMRGVAPERLGREPRGRNTREQALEVVAMVRQSDGSMPCIGIVTSPEHMMRTWLSFKHAGAGELVAIPSWPESIKADLRYDSSELGRDSLIGTVVGGSNMIKYKYFDNLGIMNRCMREAVAMAYYRLMGWI